MVVNKRKSPVVSNGPLSSFTEQLKQQARELGFVLCGVAPAAVPLRLAALERWLAAGYAGQMHYFEARKTAYAHPRHVLDGCRSVLMLALPYGQRSPPEAELTAHEDQSTVDDALRGKVAKYALGPIDYHDVIHLRMKSLRQWITDRHPAAAVRGVVDTAPLLERELAEAAGLGWVGKNTLLLNRQWGSYFFLAAVLTDLELDIDAPHDKGYCGTCTACLDACPTQAFPEPYVLDATQCISYLTIEHRDPIGEKLKDKLAGWVFGCDVCQDVCPWNRKPLNSSDSAFSPRSDLAEFDILTALELSEDEFRQRFRQTPLWRSKRRGILRNAILVAGSSPVPAAYDALCRLLDDEEPLVRGAAAWAVSRFEDEDWSQRLRERQLTERDPNVLQSIRTALQKLPDRPA